MNGFRDGVRREQSAGRVCGGRGCSRDVERPVWAAASSVAGGGDLRFVLGSDGVAGESGAIRFGARGGGPGDWDRVDAGTAVYRGGFPGGDTRAAGEYESTGDRVGDSGVVRRGLGIGGFGGRKLAMDVCERGGAIAVVSIVTGKQIGRAHV